MYDKVKCKGGDVMGRSTCERTWQSGFRAVFGKPGQAVKVVFKAMPSELPHKSRQAQGYEHEGDDQVCDVRNSNLPGLQGHAVIDLMEPSIHSAEEWVLLFKCSSSVPNRSQ